MRRFLVLLSLLAACSFMLLAACSTNHFKPSRPVEKAPTLEAAVLICAEYQIETDAKRSEERATPDKMKPWLECIEDSYNSKALALENERFMLFYRELALLVRDQRSRMRVEEYPFSDKTANSAMRAGLRSVATDGQKDAKLPVMTDEEVSALKTVFPKYSLAYSFAPSFPSAPDSCQSLAALIVYRNELETHESNAENAELKKLNHRIAALQRDRGGLCQESKSR